VSAATAGAAAPRWFAPEVVQTSAMDCGPAALKCLLEGHRIPVSYGRLREACQTDVDGTSIDTIEVVGNQLGLVAEQMMLPVDYLGLDEARLLPALVVVRHPRGGTHFVVVWRRVGSWLQLMDPATGRRWVRGEQFVEEIHRHETSVQARDWRDWAESDGFRGPLRERLALIGAGGAEGTALVERAVADPDWFGPGALDACLRLIQSLVTSGGVARGAEALRLLTALFDRTTASTGDIFRLVPQGYWMVVPDAANTDASMQKLLLRGMVVLRVSGPHAAAGLAEAQGTEGLSLELAAALGEKPARPLRAAWDIMKLEGVLRPLALATAMAIATGAVLVEAMLFRGLFDITEMLTLPTQRAAALAAVMAFAALLLVLEVPIAAEAMRIGRHLEVRLRMALLRKLPRLSDRYFHSRPISDMAERSHGIHQIRLLPGMALHFLQAVCQLLLTLLGVIRIDPASAWLAIAIVAVSMVLPVALQPLLRERDLRVRNHGGALGGFYLDALLGLVPIRAHRAEAAVRRLHEGLLVEWARASRKLLSLSVLANAAQSVLGLGLAGALLFSHFTRTGGVTGGDLLLVYWTLKLPAAGHGLTMLASQYPMQRNVLLRLLEPLSAPEETATGETASPPEAVRPQGMAIAIRGGSVLVSGHTILHGIDLDISPGEHVGIVGVSGAGKSTLVGLMLGWHRLAAGQLRIDGAPVSAAAQEDIRRATAWVDPAIQVWNRSFVDNLGYASADGGLTRIGTVIDDANLRGVLRNLPQGLQTRLGEGGALLSGGEGQRVRLGRAFTQENVRLALLDEPFRGMDRERRTALLADARRCWAGVTLLCVTHDVGETALFDRVLVVEDGRIVEDGAPERLAAAPTRYRSLLHAERAALARMWDSAAWRRVTIRDGRAHEASSRATAAGPG